MNAIPASHLDIVEAKGLSFVTTIRPDGLLSVHPVSVIAEAGGTQVQHHERPGQGP